MATKKVPRDNVAIVSIGGLQLELEASLGTSAVYFNEFAGKLGEPYKGTLENDMRTVFHLFQDTVTITAKVGDEGEVVRDEDGNPVDDPNGREIEVPNPDYVGLDVDGLLRITWAMARAAGSTRKGWDAFYEDVIHRAAGWHDELALYYAAIIHLGGGIIFRGPAQRVGEGEPDETEA